MTKTMKKNVAQIGFSLAAALLISTGAFADDFEGAPMEAGAIAMEMDAGAPMPVDAGEPMPVDSDEPMPSETIDSENGPVTTEDPNFTLSDEEFELLHGVDHDAQIIEDYVDSDAARNEALPTDGTKQSSSSNGASNIIEAMLAFQHCLDANVAAVEVCAPLNPNLSN